MIEIKIFPEYDFDTDEFIGFIGYLFDAESRAWIAVTDDYETPGQAADSAYKVYNKKPEDWRY